jgi:hypothetical protein
MDDELARELKVLKALIIDIHKLHFGDKSKPEVKRLKDKFKAEILIKSGKRKRIS